MWIAIENPNFTEPPGFLAFLKRAAPLAVLAAGQYFVIVSGEFDLSVGSLVTVTVVVAAQVLADNPTARWPVIALVLLIGALVGLANGLITTRLRVPSFIATLGMLLVLDGAVFYWTDGAPKGTLTEGFRTLGRGGIDGVPCVEQLPWSVVVFVAVGIGAVLLMRADLGKQFMAVGRQRPDGGAVRRAGGAGPHHRLRPLGLLRRPGGHPPRRLRRRVGPGGRRARVPGHHRRRARRRGARRRPRLGGGRHRRRFTLEALFTLLNLLGVSGPGRTPSRA